MLDSETKRRIDCCRDILVGKVPDPKSQVEQITIALIYKFMDDMDAQAEELGGSRSFFAGEYGKYGWARLMAPNMGGFDMLALYSEAIQKMNENPGIPPLFRDIFKNAYLPYRDPETLRIFLKEIDGFTYEHSERLGDAFEYLLSVLGSQGEAGQFRTPRHIIDFMVEIIDPKKNETILDPACGTAGFLISSYKHILKHNSKDYRARDDQEAYDEKGVPLEAVTLDSPLHYKGELLTPDERKRLAGNIKGYDISPDMVRLSLVNMYLHGFTNPHILEYDTLTSEERWNDYADIILANPPFMSPKGGIKPHKRFSIQATRSEVLFVDYIAEHLTPTGRAAVIVPEGIIFQSGGAYKQLRKMLVENYLVAVISLPAGVFNPYSGVKTSILVMNKRLSRKINSILFAKIENDGFNLGAQRRPIDKNDLPSAARNIKAWINGVRTDSPFDLQGIPNLHVVEKARIAESGEWNLSGERYTQQARLLNTQWQTVTLGEICTFMTGGTPTSTVTEYYENGTVPWLVSGDIHKMEIRDCEKRITEKGVENSNARFLPKDSVLIALNGQGKTRGTVALLRMGNATCNQSLVAITPSEPIKATPEFIFWVLRSMYANIRALTGDNERSGLNIPILKGVKIPLPPLDVQNELVEEIEGYQKIIDGARQVVKNYQPRIQIEPDWPMVELKKISEINPKKSLLETYEESLNVSFVPMADLSENEMLFFPKETRKLGEVIKQYTYFQNDDVLLAKVTPCFENGKSGIARELENGIGFGSSEFYVIRPDLKIVLPEWIYLHCITNSFKQSGKAQMTGTGGLQRVPREFVTNWKIYLPDLNIQRAIVAQIGKEQQLVNANKELIRLFEAKIKTTINRVWGDTN